MSSVPPEIDMFIRSDQRALKIYLGFVLFVICAGVVLVSVSFALGSTIGEGLQGVIYTVGGGFVASLCSFPLKEYITRSGRIRLLRSLRARWEALSAEELQRADQLIHKLYEKTMLG